MSILRKLKETDETAHPFLANVGMRTLYYRRDDGGEITCFVVRCNVGAEIEEHVHPLETDIIYARASWYLKDSGTEPTM
jgi:hypothetical protein